MIRSTVWVLSALALGFVVSVVPANAAAPIKLCHITSGCYHTPTEPLRLPTESGHPFQSYPSTRWVVHFSTGGALQNVARFDRHRHRQA